MKRSLWSALSLAAILTFVWSPAASAAPLPPEPGRRLYLPLVARDFCGASFDDFSRPTSGWPVGDAPDILFGYTDGEYQARTKATDVSYVFEEPTCARSAYSVEADMRWVGDPGEFYGLAFGIVGQFEQGYLFLVDSVGQQYALLVRSQGSFVPLIALTASAAIQADQATNHLRVEWTGREIELVANGVTLDTIQDSTVSGLTMSGLYINSRGDRPVADARYDNYRVVPLSAGMLLPARDRLMRTPHGFSREPLRVAPLPPTLRTPAAP